MTSVKFETYDAELCDWTIYLERLNNHFTAVSVTDEKIKIAVLLSSVGQATYKLLRDVCFPKTPASLKFAELCDILSKQFGKRVNIWVERRKFYDIEQYEHENAAEFLARLKKSASNCDFNDNLEHVVRDKFITGLYNPSMFERLSEEKCEVTLQSVLEIAQKREIVKEKQTDVNFVNKKCGILRPSSSNDQSRKFKLPSTPAVKQHNQQNKFNNFNRDFSKQRHFSNFNDKNYSKNRQYSNFNKNKAFCYICSKQGHVARFCRNRNKKINFVDCDESVLDFGYIDISGNIEASSSESKREYPIFSMSDVENAECNENFRIQVNIENIACRAVVDSGSCISAMNEVQYKKSFSYLKLSFDDVKLKSYNGDIFKPLGFIKVNVQYMNKKVILKMYVVKNGADYILGRDFMNYCNMKLTVCNFIENNDVMTLLQSEFPEVITNKIGRYNRELVSIKLKPDARPIFLRARNLPFALIKPVEQELLRLENEGIISRVKNSDFATPLVPVIKEKGLRLCGDFKSTINKLIEDDIHPIPKIDEIFVKLNGGKIFSKIDMNKAYHQCELDEKSKNLLTWNTHLGLFRPNRLMFGVKVATSCFQRIVEKVFSDIPEITVFIDDLIICTKTDSKEEHLTVLKKVFRRLREVGLTVNKNKCKFFQNSVDFLGFKVSSQGIHKTEEKVEAILNAKSPKSVSEVRSVIGLIQFYARFIPNLAEILEPLYKLLRKNAKFEWNSNCDLAFKKIKNLMTSDIILCHFDPKLPLILATDASDHGIAAVLLHKFPDGNERPIAFFSRTLNIHEMKYAIIQKEALAIYEGVKKFYQYLYANHFTIRCDHRPLTTIFGHDKSLPKMASNRLQRWAIFLSEFNYKIQFINGSRNFLPDFLSRCNSKVNYSNNCSKEVSFVKFVDRVNFGPINLNDIREETRKDEKLNRLIEILETNCWSKSDEIEFKAFKEKKDEIFCEEGVIFWGHRIVVPSSLRKIILKQLHSVHIGIVKTKQLARSLVYWPQIDREIEQLVKNCEACLKTRDNPPKEFSSWPRSTTPWSRVHCDHLGPILGKHFLLMVDSFSKWVEVLVVKNLSSKETLDKFREIFSRLGIPETLISDNASCFTSSEAKEFYKKNGITHITSPPFNAQSNGLAERNVRSFKSHFKAALLDQKNENCSMNTIISRILFTYRTSPNAETGITPASLIFGRELRTILTQVKEDPKKHLNIRDNDQVENREPKSSDRKFSVGEIVMVRSFYNKKPGWVRAIVVNKLGNITYHVRTESDQIWKRHANQMQHIAKERFVADKIMTDLNSNRKKNLHIKYDDRVAYFGNNDMNEIAVQLHNEVGTENQVLNDNVENHVLNEHAENHVPDEVDESIMKQNERVDEQKDEIYENEESKKDSESDISSDISDNAKSYEFERVDYPEEKTKGVKTSVTEKKRTNREVKPPRRFMDYIFQS